ncbi:MAG: GH92 family glycosyl hydrolase [Myxococcales bacterium]|nr:GH92 family glycosyl hydrolase [Myxococcales bacterium]
MLAPPSTPRAPSCLTVVGLALSLGACAGGSDDTSAGSATTTGATDSATASEATTEATTTAATETAGESEGTTGEGFDPYPWPDEALSALVDPRIGSGGLGYTVGTMNPGASLPFGMIKPGPDTGLGPLQLSFLNCTGYHYDQTDIWGFSHSRINGMGVPDYGAVLVTPTTGMTPEKAAIAGARSPFDHADEVAEPGYYAATLIDPAIRAELTTTARVARHRYTWDEPSADAAVVLNLAYNPGEGKSTASEVEIDAEAGTIRGMMTVYGGYSKRFDGLPTYFAGRFSRPIAGYGVWDDEGELLADTAAHSGAQIGAWLTFDLGGDAADVALDLAISYVSADEAAANLAALGDAGFDDTRAAATAAWEAELGRVRVLGGDDEHRRLLYSALYRSFLAPTLFTDQSGAYRGFDGEVHDAGGTDYYSDFSLWDTYRTVHPLFNLLQRDRHGAMLQSLVRMAEEGGELPKWPLGIGYTGGMVGTSADLVLADGYLKEIAGFDVDAAYVAARRHATEPVKSAGRSGIAGYRERGWVAADESSSSASRTLEFAHADYALGRWAAALGHSDDAALFGASASSWKNLWEPGVGYLIGRNADGSFLKDGFDPEVWQSYYAEGTAHHYLWSVPHDAAGLAEVMGGAAAMRERLTAYFETSANFYNGGGYTPLEPVPFYWQSNEPSLHDPYLFSEIGDPASTQRWVAWARERFYGLGADGLPGNDDAGTMSAWYVWAAIGLYPLPGADGYWITAPVFDRLELDLSDAQAPDRKLAIIAEGDAGAGAIYVAGATFAGIPLDRPWVTWDQLRAGGTLRIQRSATPTDFGAAP